MSRSGRVSPEPEHTRALRPTSDIYFAGSVGSSPDIAVHEEPEDRNCCLARMKDALFSIPGLMSILLVIVVVITGVVETTRGVAMGIEATLLVAEDLEESILQSARAIIVADLDAMVRSTRTITSGIETSLIAERKVLSRSMLGQLMNTNASFMTIDSFRSHPHPSPLDTGPYGYLAVFYNTTLALSIEFDSHRCDIGGGPSVDCADVAISFMVSNNGAVGSLPFERGPLPTMQDYVKNSKDDNPRRVIARRALETQRATGDIVLQEGFGEYWVTIMVAVPSFAPFFDPEEVALLNQRLKESLLDPENASSSESFTQLLQPMRPFGVVSVNIVGGSYSDELDRIKRFRSGELLILNWDGGIFAITNQYSNFDRSINRFDSDEKLTLNGRDLASRPISEGVRVLLDAFGGDLRNMPDEALFRTKYLDDTHRLVAIPFVLADADLRLYILTCFERDEIYGFTSALVRTSVEVGAALIVGCCAVGIFLTIALLRPLQHVRARLEMLTQLKCSDDVIQTDIGLIGAKISRGQRSMITEVQDLQAASFRVENMLQAFSKYISPSVLKAVLCSHMPATLGMSQRDVSMYFSDIEGFATFAETLSRQDLVDVTGEYMEAMSSIIMMNEGTIDKYIGDAIMAFWNAPDPVFDFIIKSVQSAVDCQRHLAALRQKWGAAGRPEFRCRIGLNTASVLVGNFGCKQKMDYTIVGHGVTRVHDLEVLNKEFGTYIMAGAAVVQGDVDRLFLTRYLGQVSFGVRAERSSVFEVICEKADASDALLCAVSRFNSAMQALERGDNVDAQSKFHEYERMRGADRSSRYMLEALEEEVTRGCAETLCCR
eukprot:NODE_255_length_2588_cov_9.716818_g233_i0.p1 GENE.NODE_255_length_2588_cov_9.716818_g233_i0~~NODE_255_length_2588_cov_9.716818_g233_i0.p1  ORF type:complete len:852 (-),score=140.68 NODE_255_length_2588_cov_9.716818_g233_i0:31-2526(-)